MPRTTGTETRVSVDTAGFANDVATMRATLEDGLGAGAERAGRLIEASLARAVRTGKFGFGDLKSVALGAMNEIAAASLKAGLRELFGGNASNGLMSAATTIIGGLFGVPGRATGGPVSPGRPYMVGERGPELFVPTSSGRVETAGRAGARDVRVSIAVNAGSAGAPEALAKSSRQVARAVRAALSVE
jgi:hypothetical protein